MKICDAKESVKMICLFSNRFGGWKLKVKESASYVFSVFRGESGLLPFPASDRWLNPMTCGAVHWPPSTSQSSLCMEVHELWWQYGDLHLYHCLLYACDSFITIFLLWRLIWWISWPSGVVIQSNLFIQIQHYMC